MAREYITPDTPRYNTMVEVIRKELGLTTLKYQTLENLIKTIGLPKEKLCTCCYDGCDPTVGCSWESSEIYCDQNDLMVNMTPVFVSNKDEWDSLFVAKLQNWVDGCIKGTELGASGEDSLAVQKMLDGIYRSAAAGKEVKIS